MKNKIKNVIIPFVRCFLGLWFLLSWGSFFYESVSYADETSSPTVNIIESGEALAHLPPTGTLVSLSPHHAPAILKGIRVLPDQPMSLEFIIDTGESHLEGQELSNEVTKLVKYFLASLTVPEDHLWVNLSPYEKNRIIPNDLGQTEMGRDLLAQDYILKQTMASLLYPEEKIGKEFWDKIRQKALEQFGTEEVPVDTYNRVNAFFS